MVVSFHLFEAITILSCIFKIEYQLKCHSEGSATVRIKNRKELTKDQESGKSFWIICDLTVIDINLPDQSDPNNVDWYKITPGQAPVKLSEDSHGETFGFNKNKGL